MGNTPVLTRDLVRTIGVPHGNTILLLRPKTTVAGREEK
jgi:hypothetical protein